MQKMLPIFKNTLFSLAFCIQVYSIFRETGKMPTPGNQVFRQQISHHKKQKCEINSKR